MNFDLSKSRTSVVVVKMKRKMERMYRMIVFCICLEGKHD